MMYGYGLIYVVYSRDVGALLPLPLVVPVCSRLSQNLLPKQARICSQVHNIYEAELNPS